MSTDRVGQFRAEIAGMKLHDPASGRDRLLLGGGAVLMAAGVLVTVAGYFLSHGTTNPLGQRDAIVVGLVGVAMTVAGGAVFLRYSLASFLRFWLARLIYEQQARADRGVEGPP